MDDNNKEMHKQRFQVSLETRKFEIELFWKRSLFFWGFIAAAFVGFATTYKEHIGLSIVIAGFGMVCSFAWTMANRGSKYWQENWETKVGEFENDITGPLFRKHEPIQEKGIWLQARRYSVSKLAIALSDYIFALWFLIFGYQTIVYTFPNKGFIECIRYWGIIFFVLSLLYVGLMLWKCRKQKGSK